MRRALFLILAINLALPGCSAANQQALPAEAAAPVTKPVYIMAGIIEANEKAGVTTKISAKVAGISVDVGSVVQKGDPLITLDSQDVDAQVAQAEASVNTAQANLVKLQAGARPEQIAEAQSKLESAEINYTNMKNNYERSQELLKAGALSQAQLETAQTQVASAQAAYESAKDQLEILIKGDTAETINVLQAQVRQAQAALEVTKTQLANVTITSPISGIVSAKNIHVGEFTSPSSILLTVVNADSLYVKASLPESFIGRVQIGGEVLVKVADISDQEFSGEVTFIDPVVDSRSRSVIVHVTANDSNSLLKPGMLAEIALKK